MHYVTCWSLEPENLCVTPRLRGLLAIVNLAVAEAEQQIAEQQKHVHKLRAGGFPVVEAEKTLLTIEAVATAMRDNQLMMERLMSGVTEH
jgi:hypothetical protein